MGLRYLRIKIGFLEKAILINSNYCETSDLGLRLEVDFVFQCSNITPDFRSMSGYRTFLSWYVRKASGFTLKVLKLSDNRSWVLIYVCAVIAKVLRWFELGNLQLSEHSDVLPTAYYEMFM